MSDILESQLLAAEAYKPSNHDMPQPYPHYPRIMPAMPESISTVLVRETFEFVNEKLGRFHEIEKRREEILKLPNQTWRENDVKKDVLDEDGNKIRAKRTRQTNSYKTRELQLWAEMCPLVVLGTKLIHMVILRKRAGMVNRGTLEQFDADTKELLEFHMKLRANRFTYERFRPYMYDYGPTSPPVTKDCPPSKYTELRAAWVHTKWYKLREEDKIRNPNKYLMWAIEAEKEWKMIKRYKEFLGEKQGGDAIADSCWSNDIVDRRLDVLEKDIAELTPPTAAWPNDS